MRGRFACPRRADLVHNRSLPMTPRKREQLRLALQKLRAQALRAAPHRIEPRADETGVGVTDEDAQALAEMLQAISSTRNKDQAALLARVDRALHKLLDAPEQYGLCEQCEEPIALKRLELLPQATLCAECQARADPRRGVGRKKLTDYRD
jgi:DnaK suppressor protein